MAWRSPRLGRDTTSCSTACLRQRKDCKVSPGYSRSVDPSPLPNDGDLDLTVTDYLARRPEAVAVFLALRMGCVGCDFSNFDTLRQALAVHGVTLQDYDSRFDGLRPPVGKPIPSEGDAQ